MTDEKKHKVNGFLKKMVFLLSNNGVLSNIMYHVLKLTGSRKTNSRTFVGYCVDE